jgi:integrase/recombinase XerD
MCNSFGNIVLGFFKDYLVSTKGLAVNSVSSYSDCMRLLFIFAAKKLNKKIENLEMENLTDEVIIDFLNYLEKERNNLPQSRNQRLVIIKTFFSFIAGKCPELIHVAERIAEIACKKVETKIISPLTEDELKLFFERINTDTTKGIRDLMIFRLMYNTGARVSEIINIQLSDMSLDSGGTLVLHGKGNKERIVVLFKETIDLIKKYLTLRESENIKSNFLILNKYNQQMTRQGINYLVTKYVNIAGKTNKGILSKNVTPHTFRHTLAFHMIKAGVNIVTIKDFLGHEDINTTSQYIKIDNQMKANAIEKINPFKNTVVEPLWENVGVMALLTNLSKKGVVLC